MRCYPVHRRSTPRSYARVKSAKKKARVRRPVQSCVRIAFGRGHSLRGRGEYGSELWNVASGARQRGSGKDFLESLGQQAGQKISAVPTSAVRGCESGRIFTVEKACFKSATCLNSPAHSTSTSTWCGRRPRNGCQRCSSNYPPCAKMPIT